MLSIRKITMDDKSRVLEICKEIWDGDDYLHLIFDNWVADKNGEFIAALDNRRIIGFIKLTMLTVQDAWIEGLRKDQHTQIKGVGRFLTEHLLAKLTQNPQIQTIRFCTYFDNRESIALYTKIGFQILEKRHHKSYRLPQIAFIPQYRGNTALVCKEKSEIIHFFHKSLQSKYLHNGIAVSWVIKPLSEELISSEFIDKNQCLAVKSKNKISALCFYTIREEEDLFISYFAADDAKSANNLLKKIKQTAYRNRQQYLSTIISAQDQKTYQLFRDFKFKSWEQENDVLIFEFPLKH